MSEAMSYFSSRQQTMPYRSRLDVGGAGRSQGVGEEGGRDEMGKGERKGWKESGKVKKNKEGRVGSCPTHTYAGTMVLSRATASFRHSSHLSGFPASRQNTP
jgi:hypothetical protein